MSDRTHIDYQLIDALVTRSGAWVTTTDLRRILNSYRMERGKAPIRTALVRRSLRRLADAGRIAFRELEHNGRIRHEWTLAATEGSE